MEKKQLTLGSLFSGSGGFELAGILAGIRPVWNSEVEPFAIRVTTKRLPQVQHFGDVSELSGAELPPVDIITFGSPCQDLSVAGKRAGLEGERSSLYVQAVRIIREMLEATNWEYPKYCVFENVPGLFSSNKGADFYSCLDMMQDLRMLPDVNVLDAQNMGVPQRRKRVYITWLNTDYILGRKMPISVSITLQLLTEILLLNLGELLRASGADLKKSGAKDQNRYDDSLKRRINLFSLQKEGRLQKLQQCLEEIKAMSLKEPISSDSNLGEDLTAGIISIITDTRFEDLKTESGYMSIGPLLKMSLDDHYHLLKESTISTPTRETMARKICTYFLALLNTLVVTLHLMQLQEKDRILLSSYEWVKYSLIEMKECINAGKKCDQCSEWMEWNDLLRAIEQILRKIEFLLERDTTEGSRSSLLFVPESLCGNTAEGFEAWKRTARNTEGGAHAAGTVCLNDQGGAYMDVSEEISGTLRAQDHGHPPLVAAGFCTEHSAKARSIGYEEEKAPTLRAGVVPAAIALEHHPTDSRIKIDDSGTMQTLCSRMGTGGNNVPLVMSPDGPVAFGISSDQSHGMLSDNPHAGIYEAKTSRTLDLNGGHPGCNQGGIAVVEKAYPIEGNGQRPSHKGDGWNDSDQMYTLNGTEQHAVAAPVYFGSKNSHLTHFTDDDLADTLVATGYKEPPVVSAEPYYIVRRLTPTECARLQGFPDWWCADLGTEDPSEEEVAFWTDVFETHRKVITHAKKSKTEKQIRKWLKDPHLDSAEYRLWGNGVALPCPWFVLSAIVHFHQMEA